MLPSTGRSGDPPRWPLQGRPPRVWAELWELPQAVMWEQLHMTRVVARYAQKLIRAERPSASGAQMSEVRQLEDRLGLSPMAMLRLGWEIPSVAPAALELVPDPDDGRADLEVLRELYGEDPGRGSPA